MTTTSTTTFEALTALGKVIRLFDTREAALAWKRSDDAGQFPGASVEEVTKTTTEIRRRVGHVVLVRSA